MKLIIPDTYTVLPPTPDSKFHIYSVFVLLEGSIKCIASVVQGLPALENYLCKIGHGNLPEPDM